MRKFLSVLVVWMCLTHFAQPLALAADETAGGFFGFKKFIKKSAADSGSKKKTKAKASEKGGKASSDTELTEEEQKQVQKMAGQMQTKSAALGKTNAKIPARVLSAPPAKVPQVVAKNAPAPPPKNPNAIIVHIPKPPGRAPQVPSGPPQVPSTSGPKKAN